MTNKLLHMEQAGTLALFPGDWQLGRRMAHEWCRVTRTMIDSVCQKRQAELDAKLLLHAIRHTAKFEQKLCRRFPVTKEEGKSFEHAIAAVFDQFAGVFLAAHERNLNDFIEHVGAASNQK